MAIRLSSSELKMIEALQAGRSVDLSSTSHEVVRGGVLREALLGEASVLPSVRSRFRDKEPRELHLRNATVEGIIDLDRLILGPPIIFENCLILDGISAHDAQIRSLALIQCTLGSGRAD